MYVQVGSAVGLKGWINMGRNKEILPRKQQGRGVVVERSSVMVRYADAGVDTPLVLLHLHREYFGEGDGGEGKEVADTAPVVKVPWA